MELNALRHIQQQIAILEASIKRLSDLGGDIPSTMIADLYALRKLITGGAHEHN